jgi:hypothetical protein
MRSGFSFASATRVSMVVVREYGARPSTAWYSVAPSDHRSDAGVETPVLARSGAMYCGVPTMIPVRVIAPPLSSNNAEPKSVSTTRPSSAINTLLGFTSRCSTPTRLAASSADRTANPIPATSPTGSGPYSSSTSSNDRERTYSITIHCRSSSDSTL